MTKRIAQAITFILALQVLPVTANIAGPYVMLVNRGPGWQQAAEFDDLSECETEAAQYAMHVKVQTGCTTARAFERWQGEVRFQQVALACATSSGVHIVLMPGAKVDVLGPQQARLDFDDCMGARRQAVQNN
jgi:hypothetical protein